MPGAYEMAGDTTVVGWRGEHADFETEGDGSVAETARVVWKSVEGSSHPDH